MPWSLLAVAYMAAIFLLSSVPDDGGAAGGRILFLPPPALQNLLHAPAYAGLAWLWWRALAGRGIRPRPAALLAAAIATAYGVANEIHQAFVPGRYATLTDALLNAAGAAAVVAWVFLRTSRPAA